MQRMVGTVMLGSVAQLTCPLAPVKPKRPNQPSSCGPLSFFLPLTPLPVARLAGVGVMEVVVAIRAAYVPTYIRTYVVGACARLAQDIDKEQVAHARRQHQRGFPAIGALVQDPGPKPLARELVQGGSKPSRRATPGTYTCRETLSDYPRPPPSPPQCSLMSSLCGPLLLFILARGWPRCLNFGDFLPQALKYMRTYLHAGAWRPLAASNVQRGVALHGMARRQRKGNVRGRGHLVPGVTPVAPVEGERERRHVGFNRGILSPLVMPES